MSLRWRVIGNTVPDLTARDVNLRPQLQRRTRYRSTNWPVKRKLLLLNSKVKKNGNFLLQIATFFNVIFWHFAMLCDISNLSLHLLKRVTSLRGQSPRHCSRAAQLLLKKYRRGGKLLATLYPI